MKKSLFIVGMVVLIFISPKVYGYVRGDRSDCPVNQNPYNDCEKTNCMIVDCPRNQECETYYDCNKPNCNIQEYHEHKTDDNTNHNQEMNHRRNRHHVSHHSN